MIRCVFNDVTERDMDLLFLEEFVSSPEFLDIFLSKVGIAGASVVEIEHSKMDLELGESDLTVIVEKDNKRYGLLIEDKIDAIAMDNQSGRYKMRGEKGVESGDYLEYFDFVVAPKKYLESNEEAHRYTNHITYEECLQYFESKTDSRYVFKVQQIKQAIEKQKHGYQVVEDEAITLFWRDYAAYQKEKFNFDFRDSLGPKGSKSTWFIFHTLHKKIKIIHKVELGNVDLEFSGVGKKIDALKRLFSFTDFEIYITGKSAVLRIRVEKINCRDSFKMCIEQVDQALQAVEKLYAALNNVSFEEIERLFEE